MAARRQHIRFTGRAIASNFWNWLYKCFENLDAIALAPQAGPLDIPMPL
jgi:hypothetical protein